MSGRWSSNSQTQCSSPLPSTHSMRKRFGSLRSFNNFAVSSIIFESTNDGLQQLYERMLIYYSEVYKMSNKKLVEFFLPLSSSVYGRTSRVNIVRP